MGVISMTWLYNRKFLNIYEAYSKPSLAKLHIYNNCVDYAKTQSAIAWGIVGYNCFKFTFGYVTPDGNYFTITPKIYNRLFR